MLNKSLPVLLVACLAAGSLKDSAKAQGVSAPAPAEYEGRWEIRLAADRPFAIIQIRRERDTWHGEVLSTLMPPERSPRLTEIRVTGEELFFSLDSELNFHGTRSGDMLEGTLEFAGGEMRWKGIATSKVILEPPPRTADETAYDEAVRLPSVGQRVDALKQFIADFPSSRYRERAAIQVFEEVLRGIPVDEPRLSAAVDALLAGRPEVSATAAAEARAKWASLANTVADRLMVRGVLLDKALSIVEQAISLIGNETSAGTRAVYMTTRGQILFKMKDYEGAEQILKDAAAEAGVEASGEAQTYLARIAEKRGQHDHAVAYYLEAVKYSRSRSLLDALEQAYVRTHGDKEGFHETLDRALSARPLPFDPGRYKPISKAETGRAVLVEVFTGSECGPCVAADVASEAIERRFDRSTVNILQYHLHVPGPDPLTNPDTMQRARYYSVRGTPTVVVDGLDAQTGGGTLEMSQALFERYISRIESRLEVPPKLQVLSLNLRLEDSRAVVTGRLGAFPNDAAMLSSLRLRIALVEPVVHYTGANGTHFHHYVVRKLLGTAEGILPGDPPESPFHESVDLAGLDADMKSYRDTFAQKNEVEWRSEVLPMDTSRLVVVAFIQNDETGEVLQSAFARPAR